MPAILIVQSPDGKILVNAMADAPQELMADAVEASSLDEAMTMAKEVLGEGSAAGDEGKAHEGAESQGAEQLEQASGADSEAGGAISGTEGMPMETNDDQMMAGFTRAKKGY